MACIKCVENLNDVYDCPSCGVNICPECEDLWGNFPICKDCSDSIAEELKCING